MHVYSMTAAQHRNHHDITSLFAQEKAEEHGFLRASAPMVRYSKLEFRLLVRKYGVKLAFTPMIIADSFNKSEKARNNEFTTRLDDSPVIAQFAAKDPNEFATAAQLIYPYVDGIDLNCGCPQSWAIAKSYGCGLLRKPEVVQDIVKTVRRTLPMEFAVSVKLRLLNGKGDEATRSTIELARQLEKCGVTFLTLHGRNMWQRSSDELNVDAMANVKQSLQVPLIVNGNVRSWQDACDLYEATKADGVMAARGLLSNPTLFEPTLASFNKTPIDCIQEWLELAAHAGDSMKFQTLHHHLIFMWNNQIPRDFRQEFNNYTKKSQIFDFFAKHFELHPREKEAVDRYEYTKCTYSHFEPDTAEYMEDANGDWNEDSDGTFFKEFRTKLDSQEKKFLDCDLEGSFLSDLYGQ